MGTLNMCAKTYEWFEVKVGTCSSSCSNCSYLLLLWKFNDSWHCIGNEVAFSPRFARIEAILDSVDFFFQLRCYSGLIFKFLLLCVIFELLCCVPILNSKTDTLVQMYINSHQPFFMSNPDRFVKILELFHIESP